MWFIAVPNAISYTTMSLSFTIISLVDTGNTSQHILQQSALYILATHHMTLPEVTKVFKLSKYGLLSKKKKIIVKL